MNLYIQPIRKIIHIDMDAFYASVEQRDNPHYRGKPVVVGGTPQVRGVVAAASYEARKYGIHSAMPSSIAIQKCRDVIFVRPRFDVYHEISQHIQEIFHRYTDLVEPLALDEAYLDVTQNKRGLPSATLIAKEIKAAIAEETRLTASAGVSINKFLAKSASSINKPDGLFLIRPENAESFVARLPIEKFFGIGKVTAAKMHTLGVYSGADLKTWSEADLVKLFGKMGSFYFHIARAKDDRQVTANRLRKSIGAEESFAQDLSGRQSILSRLEEIAQSLKERMANCGSFGKTLTLKVKYADYKQVTRSRTFSEPIVDLAKIIEVASELLNTTDAEKKPVRLLGLALSNLNGDKQYETNDDKPHCVQLTLDFD
jgi:DNA polymerase-4